MVKHNPKCLLEVTNSSSHNLPNHMISSFANQTHHNQQPFYQKHMGTYCFVRAPDIVNTKKNVLEHAVFLLKSLVLWSERAKPVFKYIQKHLYYPKHVLLCKKKNYTTEYTGVEVRI